jgi:predicted CXXCH cytochrome family protein
MKKVFVPLVLALILGTFSFLGAAAQEEKQKEKVEKSVCLACHGSYDEIAAKTAGYKTPDGETVNPHQYIPHSEKKDIPECVECHVPHPIPPESKEQVQKPKNLDLCYSCHHARNFQVCSTCH